MSEPGICYIKQEYFKILIGIKLIRNQRNPMKLSRKSVHEKIAEKLKTDTKFVLNFFVLVIAPEILVVFRTTSQRFGKRTRKSYHSHAFILRNTAHVLMDKLAASFTPMLFLKTLKPVTNQQSLIFTNTT